jgi:hypothetical protein
MQPSNINRNNLVAPTGFEPVFGRRRAFATDLAQLERVEYMQKATVLEHAYQFVL